MKISNFSLVSGVWVFWWLRVRLNAIVDGSEGEHGDVDADDASAGALAPYDLEWQTGCVDGLKIGNDEENKGEK